MPFHDTICYSEVVIPTCCEDILPPPQVEDFTSDSLSASWGGPNSCDASVDWMVAGSCGFVEDSGCSVHLEHNITLDLTRLKSPTFWNIKDPSTNKSYEVSKC